MTDARGQGEGSITPLKNGKFWARSPVMPDGKRKGLGTFPTREEAERHLDTFRFLHGHADAVVVDRLTFSRFGEEVLNVRELDGVRGVKKERSRFDCHLKDCPISGMALVEIKPPHIAETNRYFQRKRAQDKRGDRPLGRKTRQRILSLISAIFGEAVERGLIPMNPCLGMKVKKKADVEATKEVWTFLTPEEQRAVASCEGIPLEVRIMIRFVLGTGIREGEFIHNVLTDLHVDDGHVEGNHLFVRFGSKGKPPKSGKTRVVPLFGDALEAAREWIALLPSYAKKNPDGLIFPTVNGCRRQSGKPFGNGWKDLAHPRAARGPGANGWVDRLAHYYHLAGVSDREGLHFHALRHTCATSLLCGWRGRRWTLEEIRDLLGHSSITVTQRYAHLADTALKTAARETHNAGYALVTTCGPTPSSVAAISNDSEGVGRAGNDPATYGLKGHPLTQRFRVVEGSGPPENGPLVTTLAETFLDLVRRGQREAALAVGVSLASAVLAPSADVVTESRTA